MVEYQLGKDTSLGFHVDDSEVMPRQLSYLFTVQLCPCLFFILNKVTLNVCLGDVFTGGQLFFRGVRHAHL